MPIIATTFVNIICQSSMHGITHSLGSVIPCTVCYSCVSSGLKHFTDSCIFHWFMVHILYCTNIQWWISAGLTLSAHRKCTMVHYSSMVQLLSAASICLRSLFPTSGLNSGMPHMASYWSSCACVLSHISILLLFLQYNCKTAFTFWFTLTYQPHNI